ncbi:hypothetical protein X801_08901 [Opisthorchis viverrini]|uniref:Uncharacterized protein n=1 Tax=Opisthorchis viverrini TaxID=6198 RepID=A0A1S8WLJ8_OPIVI|nr:hypothetical protein X801_08901 [Opisthorchis viverrini]
MVNYSTAQLFYDFSSPATKRTTCLRISQWQLSNIIVSLYRFVRTKFTLSEVLEREKPPAVDAQYLWGSQSLTTCFDSIFGLYRGFVGAPHFAAVCRLLGYRGLYIVTTEVMKVAQSLLTDSCTKVTFDRRKSVQKTFVYIRLTICIAIKAR